MPTVPTYDGPQVREQGLSSARLAVAGGEEAFGGGAPLRQIDEAARSLFEGERKKADQIAVLDADTKTAQEKTRLFYDPQSGAQGIKGKDALGAPETYMDQFKKFTDETAKNLSPNQKDAYMRLVASHSADLESQLTKHASSEFRDFTEKTVSASLVMAKNEALLDYLNFPKVGGLIDKQKAIIVDHARSNGYYNTPQMVNMMAAAESDTHAGVIGQMVDGGQSLQAQGYLDDVREAMLPDAVLKADAHIKLKLPQDVATAIYSGIKSGNYAVDGKPPLNPDGSYDLTKVEALVKSKAGDHLDQEQVTRTVQFVDQYANQEAAALKKSNGGISNAAYSQIDALAAKSASLQDQRLIADKLVEKLPDGSDDEHDRATKYRYIDRMAKEAAGQNDPATLIAIHQGLLDGTISKPDVIVSAMEDGTLTKKTATTLIVQLNSGQSGAMANQYKQIEADAETAFPLKEDRDHFISVLRAQAIEQKISDPVELQKLYKQNMETVPTGAPGFFRVFGGKTSEYYRSQASIHANRELISAMGSGDAVFKLAQKMGGPGNFEPGSPYSNAVISLKSRGYKPADITSAKILAITDARQDGILRPEDKLQAKK